MSWEVRPDPRDDDERAALVNAANQALEHDDESAWWRAGLDELEVLGGGPAQKQTWAARA